MVADSWLYDCRLLALVFARDYICNNGTFMDINIQKIRLKKKRSLQLRVPLLTEAESRASSFTFESATRQRWQKMVSTGLEYYNTTVALRQHGSCSEVMMEE